MGTAGGMSSGARVAELGFPSMRIAVNVSAVELRAKGFVAGVRAIYGNRSIATVFRTGADRNFSYAGFNVHRDGSQGSQRQSVFNSRLTILAPAIRA
jgi:hypothetical protein